MVRSTNGVIASAGWQPGDPTAAEIAAATAEIRRSWPVWEFYLRAGKLPPPWAAVGFGGRKQEPWEFPVVRIGE